MEEPLQTEAKQALDKIFGPVGLALIIIVFTSGYIVYTLNERFTSLRTEMRDDIGVIARLELEKVVQGQRKNHETQLEQWRKDVDGVVTKLKHYEFLREYRNTEAVRELDALSLQEVHNMVTGLFWDAGRQSDVDENGRAKRDALRAQALDLVRKAIDKKISGNHDDYHNMAAELAKQNFPQYALDILGEGMRRFPNSPDLIGSAINYAVNSGNLEDGQKYFQILERLEPERWNWRAFTFAVKYQVVKGDEEKARELYEAASRHLPDDERPAVQYAELFLRRGQTAHLAEILKSTVDRVPTAPQAALKLAELYKNQGHYQGAMAMGRRALAADALDQSRINNASAHLIIGLAGEQLWAKSLGQPQKGNSTALLREFLSHYAAAIDAPDSRPFIRSAVNLRKTTVLGYLMAQGHTREQVYLLFAEIGLGNKREDIPAALLEIPRSSDTE